MELKKDNKVSLKIILLVLAFFILLIGLQTSLTGNVISQTGNIRDDEIKVNRDSSIYKQKYCNEGKTMECGLAPEVGECKRGTQTCIEGNWGKCEGEVYPSRELCDSEKDEDCDGKVDESDCYSIENKRINFFIRFLRFFGLSGNVINPTKLFLKISS